MSDFNIIVITGPTASGKTAFAARLASMINGEIISADSRQVYRRMDIGTGKDYNDYIVDDKRIPCHLIDIAEPGYKYNVYEYQRDFIAKYNELHQRNIIPVVCGGSGMYIDAVIRRYKLIRVPVNKELRKSLEGKSMAELETLLASYKNLHNKTDLDTRKRAIRAIEIEDYYSKHDPGTEDLPNIKALIIGIKYDRETRRNRISQRLEERLKSGMIDEVRTLLNEGINPDDLIYYGLEYKYITQYLMDELSYEEMKARLETAIHRFAKRQMTWFRGMERRGTRIHWIDGELPADDKIQKALDLIEGTY